MKKVIFIAGTLAAQLSFAQLYTSGSIVNQTSTPTSPNVGIGVHDPHSNLEVGDQNGGKITISTGGWSASSANPKYPTLEFAGYSNSPKARITATEETGNTNGSRFSIAVNDNTNATNLVERFSILQNGNIGINFASPQSRLTVYEGGGVGSNNFELRSNHLRNSERYFMKNIIFGTGTEDVTFYLRHDGQMYVNGNVGLGRTEPKEKLDVFGNILTGSGDSAIGINAFAIRYVKGSLNNWGSLRSSSSSYMSFGVKADGANVGWLSSSGEASLAKTAVTVGNEGFSFLSAPSQQIAIDSPVQMNEVMRITNNGNALLQGKLEAKELKVTLTPTADFVFEENYDLPKLEEVAKHIKEKKHLPEIASAKVMEKEGVNVGEFQIKLLQKIEELTLYVIKQDRQLKDQQEKMQKLETENSDLKNIASEIKQLKEQFLTMKSNATH
ncbi:hypothetical protein [Chryseobacterium sp. MEBOG07]|uniref:hypothetical protein n=1 Tax=Chryseobacterium sp. MEBOG07 TaxID=2879939 RepID=UPI001F1C0330|nr:hypothetical protein [Chryseobacterium sp. MEBOG07]UKB78207.1 hypothetical protein LF886_17215 [Chryseobacterium sp. MEBOG07]